MRSLRRPFVLVSLSVALSIASCTLITDVDRSEIPPATGGTGEAGAKSTGGSQNTGGTGGDNLGGQGGDGAGGSAGAAAGMGGA